MTGDPMNSALTEKMVEAVARQIIGHADELTTLDQAIGDADHGINMKRGMEAVLADFPKHAQKSLGDVRRKLQARNSS